RPRGRRHREELARAPAALPPRGPGAPARQEPAVRAAAPPRDGARPRAEAAPPPPRRARGRHEPRGDARAPGPHALDEEDVRPDDPPHRAPDVPRDGPLPAPPRPGLRRDDREREARGDPREPEGARVVPRAGSSASGRERFSFGGRAGVSEA